ncbi:unnamed protein product [Cuscuta epithymum]|uniref:SH3 domain-containing protein n=1 Tax=Cuscuta epithymum TaxID=186058 RepID=A0AAV0DAT3_9ASTE|nr:unnamed protein product [Cuscuta epithymum]
MDAIKKQAAKLREQVAKQQQTILRHLGQLGHEALMVDESELQCHQQLENLYRSTRDAKHFQRDIVRGIEGYISTNKKQMHIVRKLAEDSCNYGIECACNAPLAMATSNFGASHTVIQDQKETLLGILGQQVSEPIRASISGAPLEDARHLIRRYDRMRQELESQAAEVIRRQSKFRDASSESLGKLKDAERRLSELKTSMLVLGKEAAKAMLAVEEQQQQITYHKLLKMVDAERSYHRSVVSLLEKLHLEMITDEEELNESLQQDSSTAQTETASKRSTAHPQFVKVLHSFDAEADGELSLEVDDYVVVRQVAPNGWSEGECNGKGGWFPSAYVQKITPRGLASAAKDDSFLPNN